LQFDTEKWKLETGSQILLYSLSTHLPVRVKPTGDVDASGDFTDPLGLLLWMIVFVGYERWGTNTNNKMIYKAP